MTKCGREVAAVELHALDDVDGRLEALALLDGDDAVGADLLEGVGQLLADRLVVVGGDGGDLGDLLLAGDLLGLRLDVLDDRLDGLVDAARQGHRVGAGGDALSPSWKIASARTVAVVVPSPATS